MRGGSSSKFAGLSPLIRPSGTFSPLKKWGEGEPLFRLARYAPFIVIALIAVPVLAGLLGTVFPAFGYLPALGGTEFTLDYFKMLLSEPGIWRSAMLSLWTGFFATLLSVFLSGAILAASFGTKSATLLMRFLSPILALPHAAAAFGLAFLLSPSGFITRLISPELTGWQTPPESLNPGDPLALSLIMGLVVKEVPFLLLMLLAAVGQSDAPRSRNVASALGYGKLAGFTFVLWPQLYKQIRVAIFAVLAFSASVVDVSLILGPSTPPPLSVALVRWMNDPQLSYRFVACAGALLQLVLVLILFGLWESLERIGASLLHRVAPSGRRYRADRAPRMVLMTIGWALTLSVIVGIALLGVWSFAGLWTFPDAFPQSLNMNSWMRALPSIGAPLVATFTIGFCAALIATVLCVLCLVTDSAGSKSFRFLGAALSLPLIVPQTAFLFGLQIAALKSNLGYGYTALIITHLIFVLPYVFLSLAHPFQSLDKRYIHMALALGKSHTRALFQIQLPLLLRPIITAFAIGFAVSVGLYLPTLLIGAGRIPTITTEAIALASGGNRRTIGVYAFLQSIIPFVGFALAIVLPAWLFRNRAGMRIG